MVDTSKFKFSPKKKNVMHSYKNILIPIQTPVLSSKFKFLQLLIRPNSMDGLPSCTHAYRLTLGTFQFMKGGKKAWL